MKYIRFFRDFLISIGLIFLGLFYFAKSWAQPGLIWGVLFLALGTACTLKVCALPFGRISPIQLIRIYFGGGAANVVSSSERKKILGRAFPMLIFLPVILFIPVGSILREGFNFEGYFIGSGFLNVLGLFFGILYFFSIFKSIK